MKDFKIFTCPKCGSSSFGTSNTKDWDNAKGHCQSHEAKIFFGVADEVNSEPCDFTWQRKDDHLYFK